MQAAKTALALFAAWEAHDINQTAALLADDFVLTGPAPVPLDKKAFLAFQQVHTDAFPDWCFNAQVTEENKGENGDLVRAVMQITATHLGTYDVSKLGLPVPPIPATAKRRQWPQETLDITVAGGKITKAHASVSPEGGLMGTLVWLGVKLPEPPASNGATGAASLREFAYKWAQLFTAGSDLSIIDEIVAPEFVSHGFPPGVPGGPEGVRAVVGFFRTAFPDVYSKAEDVIVENDKVVERFSAGGTNLGPFFGNPPTGKRGTTTGINIFRIANGKIVEHWSNADDAGLMRQLMS